MEEKRAFIKKTDLAVLLLLVAAAAGIFYWYARKPAGAQATVTFADGRQPVQLSLATDKTYTFTGDREILVTLIVEEGSVRFSDSHCPDHICEGVGKLTGQGQSAVCMPAGVSVNIY